MNKIKIIPQAILIYFISCFLFYNSVYSFNFTDQPEYINGKVIYTDTQLPVNGGFVKIYWTEKENGKEIILENSVIQQNGTFKIFKETIQQTDGIKIMAYPNDYENFENNFEPKSLDLKEVIEVSENEYSIIIKVEKQNVIKNQQGNFQLNPESKDLRIKNFPNPFNPTTLISFDLPDPSEVTVEVFNMKGETVAVLAENIYMEKGINQMYFNASNLPSGVYIYNLSAGNFAKTGKMTLLK